MRKRIVKGRFFAVWWYSQNRVTQKILMVMVIMALLSSLVGLALTRDFTGWLLNFSTELLGAVLTFVLIDQIIGGEEKKSSLIARLRSRSNDETENTINELRRHGWLTDGSLQEATLQSANLKRVNLHMADLRKADFLQAQLMEAVLNYAKLQGARLVEAQMHQCELQWAKLQGANLNGADLEEANMYCADLQYANLTGANLSSANLREANLLGAVIANTTIFNSRTVLPDGTNWQLAMTLEKFIDSRHPDFWESDDPYSPASGRRRKQDGY